VVTEATVQTHVSAIPHKPGVGGRHALALTL